MATSAGWISPASPSAAQPQPPLARRPRPRGSPGQPERGPPPCPPPAAPPPPRRHHRRRRVPPPRLPLGREDRAPLGGFCSSAAAVPRLPVPGRPRGSRARREEPHPAPGRAPLCRVRGGGDPSSRGTGALCRGAIARGEDGCGARGGPAGVRGAEAPWRGHTLALPACAGGDATPGDGDVSVPSRGTALLAGVPHSPKRASTRSSQPAARWAPVRREGDKPSINGLF